MGKSKSQLKVIMGVMTFGEKRKEGACVHNLKDVPAILDVFQQHRHKEVDTALAYTGGTSEKYLGQLKWQDRGLIVEMKLYPASGIKHTREGIRSNFARQLESLQADKIDLYYLHGPDRLMPWEETFKATDELHREGKFNRLGISNWRADEEEHERAGKQPYISSSFSSVLSSQAPGAPGGEAATSAGTVPSSGFPHK